MCQWVTRRATGDSSGPEGLGKSLMSWASVASVVIPVSASSEASRRMLGGGPSPPAAREPAWAGAAGGPAWAGSPDC